MSARFLQIHTLTSYPSTLLNRDDVGFAKRIPFGGATRTRISSQCLKRHWRTFEGEGSLAKLGEPLAVRSRITFEEKLVKPLIERRIDAEIVRPVVAAMMKLVLGESAKAEKKKKEDAEAEGDAKAEASAETKQVTVLGPKELDYLLGVAVEICGAMKPGKDLAKEADKAAKEKLGKEARKNLEALGKAAKGLDAALFGRMVTGDILARGDAAIHVAHALTVHEEQSESDYFSAIDELLRASSDEGGQGSGHINSSELTSGFFYGYVVIDVPLLVANLEGGKAADWEKLDHGLARKVVQSVIRLVSTVSPGAKLGSTAPYASPHLVMIEAGDHQPRTLANAFLKPVDLSKKDLVSQTYRELATYLEEDAGMFPNAVPARRLSGKGDLARLLSLARQDGKLSVDALGEWATGTV
ncbi:MAG: type I-E CRISPR-associated protein Cas7/Cse4/CasC [Deltaproteobacteria bacterium]